MRHDPPGSAPPELTSAVARAFYEPALPVLRRLREQGHEAWLVGGGIRDLLLGRTTGDWDVATSAAPSAVMALWPRAVPTGVRHGTVTLPLPEGPVEITTYRTEGPYTDGRHPDWVDFGASLAEDLARRDFTVNAMAFDPETATLRRPGRGSRGSRRPRDPHGGGPRRPLPRGRTAPLARDPLRRRARVHGGGGDPGRDRAGSGRRGAGGARARARRAVEAPRRAPPFGGDRTPSPDRAPRRDPPRAPGRSGHDAEPFPRPRRVRAHAARGGCGAGRAAVGAPRRAAPRRRASRARARWWTARGPSTTTSAWGRR